MLPPCCDADNGDICGARTDAADATKCTGVGQPGVEDMACPTLKNALNMDAKGCCRPDGTCGMLSLSLMGCIERSVYPTAFLSMMPDVVAMFPLQTVQCTPATDDAGVE